MSSSKIVLKIVNICFSMLIIVVILFGFMKLGQISYEFGYRVFTESAIDKAPGTDKSIIIEKGMSAQNIAGLLKNKGLIRSSYLFIVQFKMSGYAKKVQPGTYTLSTAMKPDEMMKTISGKSDKTDKTLKTKKTSSTDEANKTVKTDKATETNKK